MQRLTDTLRQYLPLGMGTTANEPATARPAIDSNQLRADLQQVVRRSDRALWVWAVGLLVVLVLDVVFVSKNFSTPARVAALASNGFGISVILSQMRSLWKEKFSTEMLVAVLPTLSAEQLDRVLRHILATYTK